MVIGDWTADGAGFKSAKRYSITLFTVLPLTHGCYKQGVGAAACRGLNLAAVEGRRGRAGSGVGCAFCVGHRPAVAGGAGGVVQAGVKLVGAFVLQAQRVRRWCTQFVPWVKAQANIVKSVTLVHGNDVVSCLSVGDSSGRDSARGRNVRLIRRHRPWNSRRSGRTDLDMRAKLAG